MISELQSIAGTFLAILLVFFIPGYLLCKILWKKQTSLQRVGMTIGLSLAITGAVGMILGILSFFTKMPLFSQVPIIITYIAIIIILLFVSKR